MKEKNHLSKCFSVAPAHKVFPKKYFWATRFDYFQLILSIKTFLHTTPNVLLALSSQKVKLLNISKSIKIWKCGGNSSI